MSNHPSPFDALLIVSLECLLSRMAEANALVAEACDLAKSGNRNGAVGTVLSLVSLLSESRSLLDTVIVLHRSAQPVR